MRGIVLHPGLVATLLLLPLTGGSWSPAFGKPKDAPKPIPWSFQPLHQTPLPPIKAAAWPQTRLDHFTLAKIEQANMQPASRADARTLLRRLSFDLTGLPPSMADVAAFEADLKRDPQAAVTRQINRLLESPHYGERWARHWLDLARYTDQTPDWLESTKYAYLYRDWVVQAFNQDMPYNGFIIRQLATDYLPEHSPKDLVALGFIGLSPTYFKELQLPPEIIKTTVADEWEEHVDAVGRTFLGLTIACARCHDHKSDPISAKDYYALAGVFASVKLVEKPTMSAELWAPVAKARANVAAMEKQITELKKKKPKDLDAQTKELTTRISLVKTSTPHYNMLMANAVEDAALYVVEADNKKGTKLDFKTGVSRDLELQKRGNPNDTGEVVARRFLSAFPSASGQPRQFTTGSGRLELAHALVEDAAPLTARVMVNRVWKHHFGRGLVDTPSEFGNMGEAPTHPELLDDLTSRFIAHGWSLKWLHREILGSATWQQASVAPDSERRDPDNKFFARMTRRRLDWESWRDTMLTGSGTLDLRLGGAAASLAEPGNRRRSLYGASDRQDMDPMLRIHDVPDPGAHNPWRTETITPLQGLFALNSPFMSQQADAVASRLLIRPNPTKSGSSSEARRAKEDQIRLLFSHLLQRSPTPQELSALSKFTTGRENDPSVWSQCAQALLAGNEMLFVD